MWPLGGLGAVVLHLPGHDLPTLSVPSVGVTAIGAGPIAVSNLVLIGGTRLERGKTAVGDTRLAFRGTEREG